jgi:hypothetical protein
VDLVFVYGQAGEIDLLAAAPSQAGDTIAYVSPALINQLISVSFNNKTNAMV